MCHECSAAKRLNYVTNIFNCHRNVSRKLLFLEIKPHHIQLIDIHHLYNLHYYGVVKSAYH